MTNQNARYRVAFTEGTSMKDLSTKFVRGQVAYFGQVLGQCSRRDAPLVGAILDRYSAELSRRERAAEAVTTEEDDDGRT